MASQQPSMHGKVCLVTGSNSGLGRETAAGLAGLGASVILGCRDIQAAEEAAASIRKQHPEADVVVGPPLDLAKQSSVRKFVEDWERRKRPLHVLVNNAGANFSAKRHTAEGVPLICQVNYLGAYTLTRLLEPTLIASAPSRVVNVSSIMHRTGLMADAANFLKGAAAGLYRDTKLANVLHAFEISDALGRLECRYEYSAKHAYNASAVDPGGVATNVWKHEKPPVSWVVNNFYAPSADGAKTIIHAATANLVTEDKDDIAAKTRKPLRGQSLLERKHSQLRLYARGAFATKAITTYNAGNGLLGTLQAAIFALYAVSLSFLDWPVRNLSGGKYWAKTLRVPAAPRSYDAKLACALWDQSASIAQLPADPILPKKGQKGQHTRREP